MGQTRPDMEDMGAFLLVARTGGFREAARASRMSASALSDAVRRLEDELGVRLLNRTTRSVVPTQAGLSLIDRLTPAFREIQAAVDLVRDSGGKPAGTLSLNVPISAARLILPQIVPPFLAAYPEIRLEVVTDERFVDILAAGCDAGIRYDERLELDMIAVPIGPRRQRFAIAAAPAYLDLHGRPEHPRDLLNHACIRGRFAGRPVETWEFEREGEVLRVDPPGQLLVQNGTGTDLGVAAAVAGTGIVALFEDWLQPYFDSGALVPVLEDWWQVFSGPFLYYPGRRLVPAPLRAFIDFVRAHPWPA
ncbi:LysR family transcriptional regulator [Xaviernesmea oryzae]|uniref:HTH-type transcriptional regulator TtuA n=1 Tax=Xaviernesmea oryzae TaxID=464029 RepID=A0A1Q9B369_9HYPH|nr:LysR family transcriptional regulator [Xaviernesmea oryzae]OLP62461.1 LysR family transcriptional regulator [Xaviernesmea oryzae]SEM17168.1 transcriptional regulator, LysR family [Xaviernesmea oryzae]